MPLPNDPHIDEINLEGGVVEIFAMSKHQLLAALRAYKKTFNRFYADDDYWEEYVSSINAMGLEHYMNITQSVYDRMKN